MSLGSPFATIKGSCPRFPYPAVRKRIIDFCPTCRDRAEEEADHLQLQATGTFQPPPHGTAVCWVLWKGKITEKDWVEVRHVWKQDLITSSQRNIWTPFPPHSSGLHLFPHTYLLKNRPSPSPGLPAQAPWAQAADGSRRVWLWHQNCWQQEGGPGFPGASEGLAPHPQS